MPHGITILLTLGGHSSRGGHLWVDICKSYNIEVIQAPANTSHFLQPCDQTINKKFKPTIRKVRDDLCSAVLANTRTVQFKLMCAIVGHDMISTDDIRRSFQDTGLFPLNHDFSKRFRNEDEENRDKALELKRKLQDCGPSCSLRSVKKRQADAETYKELVEMFDKEQDKTQAIQKLQSVLQSARTTSNILLEVGRPKVMTTAGCGSKRIALDCGAPGVYLTVRELEMYRKEKRRPRNRRRKAKSAQNVTRLLHVVVLWV